jgi:hypothetical protein
MEEGKCTRTGVSSIATCSDLSDEVAEDSCFDAMVFEEAVDYR